MFICSLDALKKLKVFEGEKNENEKVIVEVLQQANYCRKRVGM